MLVQETPIGDVVKNYGEQSFNDIAPFGDINGNKIVHQDSIKLSPPDDVFTNGFASLEDVNRNKVPSVNDLVGNAISRDGVADNNLPTRLDHLVSNDISRFSGINENRAQTIDDLDTNNIAWLSSSDENMTPTIEDLVTNDISHSDKIDEIEAFLDDD